MKKVLIVIGTLFFLLAIPNLEAVTFEDEDTEYAIVEVEDYTCSLDQNAIINGVDEDGNLIMGNQYSLNPYTNVCSVLPELTNQEYLDAYHNTIFPYYDFNEDYMIIKYGPGHPAYILTEDEQIEEKNYYTFSDSTATRVENPTVDNLSTYYESVLFTKPIKAEIKSNVTYYTIHPTNRAIYVKVENPTIDDIKDYYIRYSKIDTTVNIVQANEEFFENLLNNLEHREVGLDYTILHSDVFGTYIIVGNTAYNIDGTEATELTEILPTHWIYNVYLYGEDLLGIHYTLGYDGEEKLKFYNKDFELLYERTSISSELYYPYNGHIYIEEPVNYDSDYAVILINRHKVVSGSTQTYNNDDLTVTFSGHLDNLETVEVNDEVLDEDNYSLTSGSTIVTLKEDYLKTLDKGTYTLKVNYLDGASASTTFLITDNNPKTADNIVSSIILMSIALIGIIYIMFSKNYKKFN